MKEVVWGQEERSLFSVSSGVGKGEGGGREGVVSVCDVGVMK